MWDAIRSFTFILIVRTFLIKYSLQGFRESVIILIRSFFSSGTKLRFSQQTFLKLLLNLLKYASYNVYIFHSFLSLDLVHREISLPGVSSSAVRLHSVLLPSQVFKVFFFPLLREFFFQHFLQHYVNLRLIS